jgi:hypothetical protein
LLSVVAICIVATPAIAQDRPNVGCILDDFGANLRLAKIATGKTTTGYHGCQPEENCTPAALQPGDLILVNRTKDNWTCGYLERRDSSGNLVWVRSKEIRLVKFDPSPPLNAWLGTWDHAEDHIQIQTSKTPGKLDLNGLAVWHGHLGVVHTGQFTGAAVPNGNQLRLVDGDGSGSCVVDLSLVGRYLGVLRRHLRSNQIARTDCFELPLPRDLPQARRIRQMLARQPPIYWDMGV